MPGGVDGLKLAETILDRWPPIEIIVTSGRRVLQADELPERGVFFPKPYQQNLVVEAIRRFAACAVLICRLLPIGEAESG